MLKSGQFLVQTGKVLHKAPEHTFLSTFKRTQIHQLNNYYIMSGVSGGTELDRLKTRAELTDKILADLRAKVAVIRQAAVKEANDKEAEILKKGITHYLEEIKNLKRALIIAEIGNGVRQVRLPNKAELAVFSAEGQAVMTPRVNGEMSTQAATTGRPAEAKVETGKKTKQQDKPEAVGGKKTKQADKSGKGDKEEGDKPKKAAATPGGGKGAGESVEAPVNISCLDMRIGKIVGVDKHPDADSLYVEQVDLGEGRHRTIVSGLVKHVPISAMKDRIAVFMCNLKPAKMRGVLSEGMIMCASSPEKVEILVPPTDAAIGDRVTVEEYPGTPDAQLNPKKKIWETLKPDVRTNSDRVATYKGSEFKIEGKGVVVAPTLADTQIS